MEGRENRRAAESCKDGSAEKLLNDQSEVGAPEIGLGVTDD